MEEKDRLQLIVLEAVQFGADAAGTPTMFYKKLEAKYGIEAVAAAKQLHRDGYMKRGTMFAFQLTRKGMQRLIQLREAVK